VGTRLPSRRLDLVRLVSQVHLGATDELGHLAVGPNGFELDDIVGEATECSLVVVEHWGVDTGAVMEQLPEVNARGDRAVWLP
jgi:hypothetical protein